MTGPAHAANVSTPPGYEFVRVLGSGGCGTVALARQAGTGRLVAVKSLHAGRADADEHRRFEREGRPLARLRDPRIVTVHAMPAVGEDLFLVLEYVDGTDLQDASERRSLDGAGTLRALTDTAAALEAAARGGVVHRDVKPANVLVADDGAAKADRLRHRAPDRGGERVPHRRGDADRHAAAAAAAVRAREPAATRTPVAASAVVGALAKTPGDRPSPGEVTAVLSERPDEWTHLVADPARARRTPEPAAAAVTPVAPAPSRVVADGAVPTVSPTVFRPAPARRPLPPAAVGVAVVLIVLAVLALVLVLT